MVSLPSSPEKENEGKSSVPPVTETAFLISQWRPTLMVPASTPTVPRSSSITELILSSPAPVFFMEPDDIIPKESICASLPA